MRTTRFLILSVLACSLMACTAQKARALRNAAIQFKAEALTAVAVMDETVKQEVAPPERTRVQADKDFGDIIIALVENTDADVFLTDDGIDDALNPYAVRPDSAAAEQVLLVRTLIEQYTAFSDAFKDLEQGFLFSASAVDAAGPTARHLTAQLVVFAKHWQDNPPRFFQQRTTISTALEEAAENQHGLSDADQRERLAALGEQWANLRAEEADAQRKVIEQCLKAATIGKQVHDMIDKFDSVSLEDIQNFVAIALQTTSSLTGADLSSLTRQTDELFSTLNSDPLWRESIEIALALASGRDPQTVPVD